MNTAKARFTVTIAVSSRRPNTGPNRLRITELGLSTITCEAIHRPLRVFG